MSAPGIPAMTRDDLLAELLERYDDAVDAGRTIDPRDLCRDHPDLLDPFVALLRDLGRVDAVFGGGGVNAAHTPIDAGRYTPTEFVGEGGLGVVFRGTDGELGRTVALKWMKPLAALNSAARQRFRVEAEITGKLEHPGVAPVYGAGEEPDTRMPYYAMRFIEGQTLADHIKAYHTEPAQPTARRVEFTRLLRAFAAVCQTVAYAHSRGVVHRDIKPGNVMLGPYGETLLVDWGLAKEFDPTKPFDPTASGGVPIDLVPATAAETVASAQTVSGRAKGTPAYMPPEQARGHWTLVGPAADIYALGATLYHLLCGHAPYSEAKDKLAAVKAGPPRAVRKVNPAAPKPLAAVCAKAMSRNPVGRYATAQELAADVERWLADEPLTAYRDPLFTRCRRWVKRHRTLTAAVAAALLVLTAGLAVIAPVLTAKNQELAKANGDLNTANTNLTAANEKLTDAAAAAREDYEEADDDLKRLLEVAFVRVGEGKNDLVQKAQWAAIRRYRDYQTGFIARNAHRTERRFEVGAAWLKVAELEYTLGRLTEASAAADAAERLFTELAAERADDREVQFGRAAAWQQQGMVRADLGNLSGAEPPLLAARDTFRLLATDPTPLRISRLGSLGENAHRDSPSFRLAATLTVLAQVRAQVVRLEQAAGMPSKTNVSADYRDELKAALAALTEDKPLPPDAPLSTRLTALHLRLQIAALDTDPLKAHREFLEVAKDAAAFGERHPEMYEFWALAVEAEWAAAQIELFQARSLLQAMWAAFENKQEAEAKRLAKECDVVLGVAQERMAAIELAAGRLEAADFGIDLTNARATALVVLVEMGAAAVAVYDELNQPADAARCSAVTVAALKRLTDLKPLPPDAAVRGVQAAISLSSAAYMASKKGPRPNEPAKEYTARTKQFANDAAAAVQYATALNDRLVESSPDEPAYRRMNAYLSVVLVDKAGERGEPVGEPLKRAEKAVAALRDDPMEWYRLFVEMLLLNSQAAYQADEKKELEAALKLLTQAEAKRDEAEAKGMPPMLADLFRILFAITKADALRIQAEALLNTPTPDRPKAAELVARGLKLIRESEAVVVRGEQDPDMQQRVSFARWRQKTGRAMLEKLESRLNPKK